ncbi:MAG: RagB/SusD family nutrient uptake outer membrane protein [Deltaproteobacteria bacterium]
MKKNIIIIVLFSLALFSCSGLLDVNPVDAISDEIAIKDRAGVEKALTGSYNSLQSIGLYGRYQVIVGDLAADNLIWTGTTQDFGQMLIKPIPSDNSLIESMWTGAYDGINRVNNILDKLPGISGMTKAEQDQFMGEALFLRSLLYFNLANYFGNVPLRLKPTLDLSNIDMAATSQQLIIKQCTEDLRTASKLMSATQVSGHANKYSAEALLAKVYLTDFHLTNNKTSADSSVAVANRVINTGRNMLFEVVFDIQNYNRLAQYFFSRSYAGRYEIAPSEALINSYEPLDNRKNASIALDDKNKPYCIKYKDVSGGADNVAVIRSEDIYLTRAEALAYSNGNITTIKSDINFIRNKAGLANTSADNYNDLKIAVENERRHEFAFEGHRWVDLVRTKRATTVLGIDQKNTLFPIPLFELQTNKLLK